MQEQEIISAIEELGLSNKEARVYVAALSAGASSVQRLADQSGIKRVTVYVILESLMGMGLMSQTSKGKKTYFVAEDPANLHRLVDKRQQEVSAQQQGLDALIPKLSQLLVPESDQTTVRLYDTADGIQSVMRTFIKEALRDKQTSVVGFSNLDQLYSYFPEFRVSHANPERTRAGIKSRFLYTSSQGAVMAQFDQQTRRVSRWIPVDKWPVQGDFTVAGDSIMMLSFAGSHPTGISIKSPELAQGLRVMFDLAWQASEQYN
ncbi:hypothetical protein IPG36_03095 [bacterium]|nr:MAG: hypothetical protein IPG36_03095 [bacterium]